MTPCPAIIERTHYGRYPKPPLSPSERIESWRRKWARLTVEETLIDTQHPNGAAPCMASRNFTWTQTISMFAVMTNRMSARGSTNKGCLPIPSECGRGNARAEPRD